MGHRNTSARFGGVSGFFGAGKRTGGAAADGALVSDSRSISARILLGVIRGYQMFFSPVMASPCKFYPSCSRYAEEAIAIHGARRGSMLAAKRLLRCRPGTRGGVDFVPERIETTPASTMKECLR